MSEDQINHCLDSIAKAQHALARAISALPMRDPHERELSDCAANLECTRARIAQRRKPAREQTQLFARR